jgi:hypothetical protein
MFRTPPQLVAALLLISVVGGCTSAAATTAPSTNPVVVASAGAPSPTGATPIATLTAAPSAMVTATGTAALGGPVAKGGNFCGLLGPGDFLAVGVSGAHTPTKNSDGTADAYCVYAGVSGATGGVEFDIFTGDPVSSYQQIVSNAALIADTTGDLPGVDNVGMVTSGPGNMAAIGVQKGRMTFDIDIPAGPKARAQLIALAKLVLERGIGLSS